MANEKATKNVQPTAPTTSKNNPPPPPAPRVLTDAKHAEPKHDAKHDAKPEEAKPAEPKQDAKPEVVVDVKRVFTDPAGPLPAEPPRLTDPDPAAELKKELAKKPLTVDEQKALFAAVFAELDAIAAAELAIEEAGKRRNVAVRALVAGMNGKMGTYKIRGKHYRARYRGEGAFFVPVENLDVTEFDV